jgi:hypothetical protein
MSHRKINTVRDINAVIGESLIVQPQSSHLQMLTSVMKPLASNFEIRITLVRVNADNETAKIKQCVPSGFHVKKVLQEISDIDESEYTVVKLTRLTGQTISIYPVDVDVAAASVQQSPIIITSHKIENIEERRKGKIPLKFSVMVPKGWICTSFENSGANDFKNIGAEFTHAVYRIYSEFLETGNVDRAALEDVKEAFIKEFYGDEASNVTFKCYMPSHRTIAALIDSMCHIDDLKKKYSELEKAVSK